VNLPPATHARRASLAWFALVAGTVLVLDQVTKHLAATQLAPGDSIRVWGDVVRLTLVRNRGAAFGLLQGNVSFLVLASIVAIAVVAYALYLLPPERRRDRLALGLVGGGALGNLVDRVRLGEVVDFLDVGWGDHYRWPTFNVADSAVTVGVALMFLWVRGSRQRAPATPAVEAVPEERTS
jgi:signal peptidase II